jgi:hypothetical protein
MGTTEILAQANLVASRHRENLLLANLDGATIGA